MVCTCLLSKKPCSLYCAFDQREQGRQGWACLQPLILGSLQPSSVTRGAVTSHQFSSPYAFWVWTPPPLCTRSCILMLVAVSTVQNSCENPSSRQCPCWYTPFTPHSLMLKTAPLSSSIFQPLLVGCSSFPPQSSPVRCVVCLSWWWPGGHSVFYALSLWWPSVGLWYNFPPFGWTLPIPFLYVMYVNEFWAAICLSFSSGSSSVVVSHFLPLSVTFLQWVFCFFHKLLFCEYGLLAECVVLLPIGWESAWNTINVVSF